MTREHDNVTAQLTQAEQVKLVAEGELAEVGTFTRLVVSSRLLFVRPVKARTGGSANDTIKLWQRCAIANSTHAFACV